MAEVVIHGLSEMLAALAAKVEAVDPATEDGISQGMEHLSDVTEGLLELTAHPPNTPTPSRPGEPPSLISGRLRDSVFGTGPSRVDGGYSGLVGPSTVYARIQELGGISGKGYRTHLPPRPYLKPALELASDGFDSIMQEVWADAVSS